jgi:hypothetical protein
MIAFRAFLLVTERCAVRQIVAGLCILHDGVVETDKVGLTGLFSRAQGTADAVWGRRSHIGYGVCGPGIDFEGDAGILAPGIHRIDLVFASIRIRCCSFDHMQVLVSASKGARALLALVEPVDGCIRVVIGRFRVIVCHRARIGFVGEAAALEEQRCQKDCLT